MERRPHEVLNKLSKHIERLHSAAKDLAVEYTEAEIALVAGAAHQNVIGEMRRMRSKALEATQI